MKTSSKKKKYNKKYWKKNSAKLKTVNNVRSTTWYHKVHKPRRTKPEWRFAEYKRSAERTGRVFEFTLEEFLEFVDKPCFYCGEIPPAVGVDRVDNDVGYTKENSVPCCSTCNWMKKSLPQEVFVEKCMQISKHHAHRTN